MGLNYKDEESLELLLAMVDRCVQYGEDFEPKEIVDEEQDD